MRGAVIVFTIVLCCHPSVLRAEVGSPETHDKTELVLITMNSAISFVNVAALMSGDALDWAIGFGVASGFTTIVYTATADHLERETGLPLSGLAAIGTSLLSLGFRHESNQVRMEPSWYRGSPGLSLVVDF